MLTETKLQALRRSPKTDTVTKIADRDGLYIRVTPHGTISFRWNFWMGGRSGRRGTVNYGQYPVVSLAEARLLHAKAKDDVAHVIDPARKKTTKRTAIRDSGTFADWWQNYIMHSDLADSIVAMRSAVYKRDVEKRIGRLKFHEIDETMVRQICDSIVDRGAPAVAIHVRDFILQVFSWAKLKAEKVINPTSEVAPSSIAKFHPRERNLSPEEIATALEMYRFVGANLSVKAGTKLLLMTFVRKSELTKATWDEINFEEALWTIPAARMKKRPPHVVPLSNQALDILIGLKTLAGSSEFILPSRYDSTKPMSSATFNRFFQQLSEEAEKQGKILPHFGPHDLRRTASTLLHERGVPSDWIEKQLAHEQRGVRAVYNKAEYLEQRRSMMQQWSDMIDGYAKHSS